MQQAPAPPCQPAGILVSGGHGEAVAGLALAAAQHRLPASLQHMGEDAVQQLAVEFGCSQHAVAHLRTAIAPVGNRLEEPARLVEPALPAMEAELVVEKRADQSQGSGLPRASVVRFNVCCVALFITITSLSLSG